jgi:hypothetical protein
LAATTSFDPDYKVYDFDVEAEDWNEYDLQDGARIRTRMVIIKFLKRKSTPEGQYEAQSQAVQSTNTNASMRRPPSPLKPEELIPPGPVNKIPVKVLTSTEVWNVYRLRKTDERIRIKMILIDVFRLPDRYDDYGEPMYLTTFGQVLAPIVPVGSRLTE